MDKLNKNSGITLIALVITIIVLLILAGITINLTIGQSGIMNMAEKDGENYIDAEKAEQEELAKLENYIDNSRQNVTVKTKTIDVILTKSKSATTTVSDLVRITPEQLGFEEIYGISGISCGVAWYSSTKFAELHHIEKDGNDLLIRGFLGTYDSYTYSITFIGR